MLPLNVVAADQGTGSTLGALLPLLLIVLVGYFLLVRPARTRQREMNAVRVNLAPGVQVQTTAGLLATVVAIEDGVVVLEVAPGVYSRYLTPAVARVLTPSEPEPTAGEAEPGRRTGEGGDASSGAHPLS